MRLLMWSGIGALALALMAAPAEARREIVVDWKAALIYPMENGRLVRGPFITNNGKVLKPRHLGTFRISEKIVDKRSNMYNTDGEPIRPGDQGALMRYWMRLGNTAQGLHQSGMFSADGPRHRSNGCYRLPKSTAVWLFNWAPLGTPVHVVSDVCSSRYAWIAKTRCERVAAKPKPSPAAARRAAAVPAKTVRETADAPRRTAPRAPARSG